MTVTLTTLAINPVHTMANRVAYYIWDVRDVELQVTDSRLSRVAEWNQLLACLGEDQFQSARITASAVISSADNSFTATNVLPLIADKVRNFFSQFLNVSCVHFLLLNSLWCQMKQ